MLFLKHAKPDKPAPLLTNAIVFLRQEELKTTGSSFGEAKSQESAEKWKIRNAAESHSVTEVQSHGKWTSSCLLYPWWPRDCKGLGLCAATGDSGRWEFGWLGTAVQITVTAESLSPWYRQIQTNQILWKWSNAANSSAPALDNLLLPLSHNFLLSLETTAESARGLRQGHLILANVSEVFTKKLLLWHGVMSFKDTKWEGLSFSFCVPALPSCLS